jgi:putative aminopeptidase FrvX
MEKQTIELLKTLTELPGAPGFEFKVRKFMEQELGKYSDQFLYDKLGSVFAVKPSSVENAPKVLVAGHMDEVGFMVTKITDNGMIKFQTLGGWWNQNMLSQRVHLHTKDSVLLGVIGSISPHLLTPEQRAKPMEIKNMMIDIGVKSKEEAIELGVKPGQMMTPVSEFEVLGKGERLMGKAFDNRYGCAIAIEVFKELADEDLAFDLVCGATVQEEVGLRGATTAANLIKPDMFIGADCSPARDTSGDKTQLGQLGEGPLLRIHDRAMITSPKMVDYVLEKCEAYDHKYQYYTSPGGTDAGAIHMSGEGVPSIIIGIASRNIHSHNSIIDTNDYDNAKALIKSMLLDLNREIIEEIKKG